MLKMLNVKNKTTLQRASWWSMLQIQAKVWRDSEQQGEIFFLV